MVGKGGMKLEFGATTKEKFTEIIVHEDDTSNYESSESNDESSDSSDESDEKSSSDENESDENGIIE